MKPTSGRSSASPDRLTVLYDGWALAFAPCSPAALHLLGILSALPPVVEPVVLLPAKPVFDLPETVRAVIYPRPNVPAARLRWEQATLPVVARRLLVDILHVTTASAPLLHRKPVVLSPAESLDHSEPGGRLRAALGRGGWSTANALLWPEDLAQSIEATDGRVHSLPPLAHPGFQPQAADFFSAGTPFILLPAPQVAEDLRPALAAWSWVITSLGEGFELVLCGLDERGEQTLHRLLKDESWKTSVHVENPTNLAALTELFRQASAVLHMGESSPWGDDVIHALASGRPIVGIEGEGLARRVGPAAYLVPPGDPRALAAALITVLIEEDVAAQLSEQSAQRAQGWESDAYGEELLRVYREVCS